MRAKLKRVNQWAKSVRSLFKMKVIWKTFCRKMAGHINYFAVTFNITAVGRFVMRSTQILHKWLNRRSQHRHLNWDKFNRFMAANPLPAIYVKVDLTLAAHQR